MTDHTYSPYELDDFQRCSKLWDLKQRWEPREQEWSPALVLGTVIAEGLGVLRRKGSWEEAERVALASLSTRYEESEEWTLKGLKKHVLKGLSLGMSTDLGLRSVISVDSTQYGRCRPDVVGRTYSGALRVVDDKVKLKLDARYVDDELSMYQHSNQVYEYAWLVGQYYQEPVTSVGINLIILTPRPDAKFYPIRLKPEVVEYWAAGAEVCFEDMASIQQGYAKPLPRWTSCTDRYKRRCQFWTICHDLAGNEGKADAFYLRK